jgi:hypothetical protein
MTPYSCLPVSGSSDAAYQNGAITCTELPSCKVTLYEHWDDSNDAQNTGEVRTLPAGIGMFPLEDMSSIVSSIKVEGEACVAYGYADENCQGQKSQGIAEGVVSGSTAMTEKWGCNDCIKCVEVERVF